MTEVNHNTASVFCVRVHGCQRPECRAAERKYQQKRRQRNVLRARRGQARFRHGCHGYNNYGCRCEVCTAAVAAARLTWSKGTGRRASEGAT